MSDTLTELMVDAAIAASGAILEVYASPFSAVAKADGSPVTEADQRAEAIILDRLSITGLPVLAEESAARGHIPALQERFFVVDPLDGTKEFIKRNGEFTVNIALVERGRPVVGVVMAPATGAAYTGDAKGAFAFDVRHGVLGERRPITVRHDMPFKVVASRSHGHAALASLRETLEVGEDVSVGSSLKFCLLAEGMAQLYPRFTPTSEWDTAAGQAVLEAAGGTVLTMDGQALAYGKAESGFINPYFVAASEGGLARRAASEMLRLTDLLSVG